MITMLSMVYAKLGGQRCLFQITCSISPHRCSLGLRTGDWAGHSHVCGKIPGQLQPCHMGYYPTERKYICRCIQRLLEEMHSCYAFIKVTQTAPWNTPNYNHNPTPEHQHHQPAILKHVTIYAGAHMVFCIPFSSLQLGTAGARNIFPIVSVQCFLYLVFCT